VETLRREHQTPCCWGEARCPFPGFPKTSPRWWPTNANTACTPKDKGMPLFIAYIGALSVLKTPFHPNRKTFNPLRRSCLQGKRLKRPRPKRTTNFRYDQNGPPLSLAFETWLVLKVYVFKATHKCFIRGLACASVSCRRYCCRLLLLHCVQF